METPALDAITSDTALERWPVGSVEQVVVLAARAELAAAVREAVMASAEVCRGRCGGRGHVLNSLDSVEPTSPCPTCSGRGILFGRGVVEGET